MSKKILKKKEKSCNLRVGVHFRPMPGQRKKGKVKLNVWMDDEAQKERLMDAADKMGFATLTEYLKWVADQRGDGLESNPPPSPVTPASSASRKDKSK